MTDPMNVRGSIAALPDQALHAFEEAQQTEVPEGHKGCSRLVCSGMGGSGLGARFIETVFADELKVPIVRVHGYKLPGFVGPESLVLCSSYSGTTEETVATWDEAEARGAKLMAIATGKTLIARAERAGAPLYRIDPVHNPSGQPRMAVGYSIVGQLVLVAKAGLISLTKEDIASAAAAMRRAQAREDEAKALAGNAEGRIVVFAAAEHLTGPLHTVNNQFNENAKTLTFDFALPELNHHLLEGLKYPGANRDHVLLVLVDSEGYDTRNRRRLMLTKDVAEQNGIRVVVHEVERGSKLAEGFALIQFGALANYHLAMRYGQDPAPIPFVDYFKRQMDLLAKAAEQ